MKINFFYTTHSYLVNNNDLYWLALKSYWNLIETKQVFDHILMLFIINSIPLQYELYNIYVSQTAAQ